MLHPLPPPPIHVYPVTADTPHRNFLKGFSILLALVRGGQRAGPPPSSSTKRGLVYQRRGHSGLSREAGVPGRGPPHLSEQEGHHVGRLPVAGVEEVGQGHGGEGGQRVGAVQGVVQPLLAPPPGGNCRGTGVTGLRPEGLTWPLGPGSGRRRGDPPASEQGRGQQPKLTSSSQAGWRGSRGRHRRPGQGPSSQSARRPAA